MLQNQVGDELETSAGEQLLKRRFSFEDIDSVAELRSEAIAVVQALESALTDR